MRKSIAAALAASLLAGGAIAQDARESSPGALERRMERIEKALERLESKLAGRRAQRGGGMMEGCRDMMGGGTMGGQPNQQWRPSEQKR